MKTRLDVLVCYDVATTDAGGKLRLRRIAKACEGFGQRVQYSVFELKVTPVGLEVFLQRAVEILRPETDSLRVYTLSGPRESFLRVYGRDGWTDFEGPLIL